MISKFVFVVAVDIENSRIAVGKMFKTVSHHSEIGTDVPSHYANWAGRLSAPVKFFGPGVQM
jgi:hypothetical protein